MMGSSYVAQQQSGSAPIQVATPLPPANRYARGDDVFLDKHLKVKRTGTHNFSIVLNLVTCGAALNIALAQVLGMVMHRVSWLEMVVRVYEILFSILVVLNEMQWTELVKESRILSSYTFRGILYTFIGILGVLMNDIGQNGYNQSQSNSYGSYSNNNITIYLPTQEQALELYIRVVSWSMVGFGVVYIIMGVLRVQQKVDRHKEEYHLRLAHAGQETNGKGLSMCGVMA